MTRAVLKNYKGGAFGTILLTIAIILLVFFIFINAVDYALFTFKRNIIGRGIDYSVSAAVQEIDEEVSAEGLSEGCDEATGIVSVDNISLDEEAADNAFYGTLLANTGIQRASIEGHMLVVTTSASSGYLYYNVRAGGPGSSGELSETGSLSNPGELEGKINNAIDGFWGSIGPDSHIIYVNGNPDTNEFKFRPYYIVIIKNYQIDSLFRKREATFVAFKGAKIERAD